MKSVVARRLVGSQLTNSTCRPPTEQQSFYLSDQKEGDKQEYNSVLLLANKRNNSVVDHFRDILKSKETDVSW